VSSIISVLQLEQLRRSTGLSLQAISESTKISTSYLRAIESEEFDKLPGGVYNTSYISQYASAIGFSQAELLALYRAKTAPVEEESTVAAQPTRQSMGVFRAFLNWLRNPSPQPW
jgi:cytoskeletal protein RodZ